MKIGKFNSAKSKLKQAGIITTIGFMGFIAPKATNAQENESSVKTITSYTTNVKMGFSY